MMQDSDEAGVPDREHDDLEDRGGGFAAPRPDDLLDGRLARLEAVSDRLERLLAAMPPQAATHPLASSEGGRPVWRRAEQDRLSTLERRVEGLTAEIVAMRWTLGDFSDRALTLQGRVAAHVVGGDRRLKCLADAEFRVYSQWGEDGIIDWLTANLDLPNRRFVEFGVETFREANCRFLLQHRGWRGLVMDGSSSNMSALRTESLYWMADLTAKAAFIDADNINELIAEAGFSGPLGILSIDLDGNDYWVWKAIDCVDPAIVICEYNTALGDLRPVTIPYAPAFSRLDAHPSGQYFGASLPALERLAREKGYTLLGTCSAGVNAFFVRDDLARGLRERLDVVATFPSRHRDSRDAAGNLSFARGTERIDLIRDMPVVDVETGEVRPLGGPEGAYSEAWLRLMQETPGAARAGASAGP